LDELIKKKEELERRLMTKLKSVMKEDKEELFALIQQKVLFPDIVTKSTRSNQEYVG
jgi:hypothetical protein